MIPDIIKKFIPRLMEKGAPGIATATKNRTRPEFEQGLNESIRTATDILQQKHNEKLEKMRTSIVQDVDFINKHDYTGQVASIYLYCMTMIGNVAADQGIEMPYNRRAEIANLLHEQFKKCGYIKDGLKLVVRRSWKLKFSFTNAYGEHLDPGTLVYEPRGHDYGLARDDTNFTGKDHKSVTLSPEGDIPFFTIEEDYLDPVQ